MEKHLLDGRPLRLGGKDYVMPPLNLAALEKYWPVIESWTEPPAKLTQRFSEGAEVIHAALCAQLPGAHPDRGQGGPGPALVSRRPGGPPGGRGLTRVPPGELQAGSVPDWGYLYARIISQTGWTWEYIGQNMTLPRLYEMQRYWEQHPPVGDLVAAYLGYEVKAKGTNKRSPDYGSPEELISAFSTAGGKVSGSRRL